MTNMIAFYDNNYATADRYSVCVKEGEGVYHWYSFSMNAGEPNGINLYCGTTDDNIPQDHDIPITWYDLPLQVQVACLQRLDPRE